MATALLVLGAQAGVAQSPPSVELRGGLSVPAGDLAEVGDPGAGVGVGLAFPITSRVALRFDGDFEVLSEDRVGGPGGVIMPRSYLWHLHGGLDLDLLTTDSGWRVGLRGGAGGTVFDTELFVSGDDFLDTYFSVSGGLQLGRQVGSSLELGVIGQTFVVFTDEDRTEEFARQAAVLNAFPAASSFPLQLYLRWSR